MSDPQDKTPLSLLAVGERGKVVGFDLPAGSKARLFEMGLTNGAEVEVVRFAPLGDPIDIKVRNYHLSLRKREAVGILVAKL
jgi:ferrous iron transport protein A